MTVDLGRVRERMVDLEDFHAEEINVEEVMARYLDYPDAEKLGESVRAEVERALIVFRSVYERMGARRKPENFMAIGFLWGLTFATAYRQVEAETGET